MDEVRPGGRSTPARIVVADDHGLVRQGLRSMLAYEAGLELVGEAQDGREAVEMCSRLQPDLVLMDVRMPGTDGLAATRQIKKANPKIGVLIVTMHENPGYLVEAIKAGAAGYVLKGSPNSQIVSAIRRVLNGESPLNQELALYTIHDLVHGGPSGANHSTRPQPDDRPCPPSPSLTNRELEVLQLLAQGQTNQEIAQRLVVSSLTVKTHVQHIIRKLGVSDRTQAAVHAAALGLVTSESA